MTHSHRWPVTLTCYGTEATPHEQVTWVGTWTAGDESTNESACWVCGGHPCTTPPRYPYVRGHAVT